MRRYHKYMNELKRKRKELGLTQIQAANVCGVSRRTYQAYEERKNSNDRSRQLLFKLENNGTVCTIRQIKKAFKEIVSICPEIEAAYVFGSYARGEASVDSDIDILVVVPPMGMKLYNAIAKLEDLLHKQIDFHTHRQLIKDAKFTEEVLKDAIKIYS